MNDSFDLETKRKRIFFSFCAFLTITAFTIISVVDILEHDFLELIIDLVILAIMAGSLILLKINTGDIAVYRTTHLLISLSFFYSVAIGAGAETVLYWVFIMPLLFFYFFGMLEGLLWAICFYAGIAIILLAPTLFNGHVYHDVTISRFLLTLFIVNIIGYGLESSRYQFNKMLDEKNQALQEEKKRLETALKEIKTLSGLIPICSSCKKVRNDEGFWEQVEYYVRDRSDADFSHSLCPKCAKTLYPGIKF